MTEIISHTPHSHDGYIYVIEFSDKTVKIGRTQSMERRGAQHDGDAQKFGLTIVRTWSSPAHRKYKSNENALGKYCREIPGSENRAREYFTGVDFDDVVLFANGLDLSPSTPDERDADDEKSRRASDALKAATIGRKDGAGKLYWVATGRESQAYILGRFFDHRLPLPKFTDRDNPNLDAIRELASSICTGSDYTYRDLDDWSDLDLLEHLLDSVVETAKIQFRNRIVEEGRSDLLAPSLFAGRLGMSTI